MNPVTDNDDKGVGNVARLVVSWVWIGVPLVWGVWQTFVKALALFQ